MIEEKIHEIIENIKNLTLFEANELVLKLKKEFNIENLATVNSVSISTASKETSVEKTKFSLYLDKISQDKKISVLKVIKKTLNLNLKEAKDFIDSVPKLIKNDFNKQEAEDLKKELEEIGAIVRLE